MSLCQVCRLMLTQPHEDRRIFAGMVAKPCAMARSKAMQMSELRVSTYISNLGISPVHPIARALPPGTLVAR